MSELRERLSKLLPKKTKSLGHLRCDDSYDAAIEDCLDYLEKHALIKYGKMGFSMWESIPHKNATHSMITLGLQEWRHETLADAVRYFLDNGSIENYRLREALEREEQSK